MKGYHMIIKRFFEREKMLYLYVLFQAIKDYIKGDFVLRADAYKWIKSESTELNSFNNICDILNCDPEKIRQAIFNHTRIGIIETF